jgi:hypothetical protein
VSAIAGIAHRSPQLILFRNGRACFTSIELRFVPPELVPGAARTICRPTLAAASRRSVVTLEP